MCTSFKSASNVLCHSLALTAKGLCTILVNPRCISPLLACRLIALDKNLGVRPIEVPHCIVTKATLTVTRSDTLDLDSSTQLCAGQMAGDKSAVCAVRQCLQQDISEAVLLVDTSNAFNLLNCKVVLCARSFPLSS